MANDFWNGRRGPGRPAGGMKGQPVRPHQAPWSDYADYPDEPPMWNARRRGMRRPPHLDMLTARLERLAERLDPYGYAADDAGYGYGPGYDGYGDPRDAQGDDIDDLIAALAQRAEMGDERVASALDVLMQTLGREPGASGSEIAEASAPPPSPAAAPARPAENAAHASRPATVQERIAALGGMLNDAAAQMQARAAETKPSAPAAPELPVQAAPDPSAPAPMPPRLRNAVMEIAARQKALEKEAPASGEAAKSADGGERVRALESRLADITAKLDAAMARPAPGSASPSLEAETLRQDIASLNATVQDLAARVGAIQDNAVNPSTLKAIYRSLDNIVQRLNADQEPKVPAAAIDQVRGAVEGLAARLENAQPGAEVQTVLEAIQRSIEHLAVRLDQAVQAPTTTAALAAMQDALDQIAERVVTLDTLSGRTAKLQSIETAINTIVREVRAMQATRPSVDLTAVTGPLDDLRQRFGALDMLAGRTEKLHGIETTLNALVQEIKASRAAPEIVNVKHTIDDFSERFDERFSAIDTLLGRTEKLGAMESAINRLAEGFNPDQLSSELAAVKQGFEERLAAIEALVERTGKLDAIELALQKLTEEVRTAPSMIGPEAITAMQGTLETISERASAIDASLGSAAKLDTLEQSIGQLVEEVRAKDFSAAPHFSELQRLIGDLSHRLEKTSFQVTAEGIAPDALASIERAIEDLTRRFDSQAGAAYNPDTLDNIQNAIEKLADRLENNGVASNQDAHAAIQQALEAMESRLSASQLDSHSLTALEDTAERLSQMMEEMRGSSVEAAQAAAARAVRDALADFTHTPSPQEETLASLADSLNALQTQSYSATQRTVDAFDAVRSALDRVVERLARLEEGGRSAPSRNAVIAPPPPREDTREAAAEAAPRPAAPVHDPIAAARAAARRALEESAEVDAATSDSESDARDKRLRFIAAARRAAGGSGMPASMQTEVVEEEAANGNRRHLLIGIAAILLILGSFQFARMAIKSEPRAGETIEHTAQIERPATEDNRTALLLETVPALPAGTFTATSTTGATGLERTNSTTVTEATTPSSPVVTGSIGTQAAAVTPDLPLPENIGGPRLISAVNAGDLNAIYEVGVRLFNGEHVTRDLTAAAEWFRQAAEAGHAAAQYRYANALDKGHGVAANQKEAEVWYRRAAEQGHIKAMHNLAVLHAEGGLGESNYKEAAHWFRMAADRGVRDSQYNLAVMLARGLGVEQNLEDAFKWFAIAAAAGDQDAATKRDQVAAKLDPDALVAARLEARIWQAVPTDSTANGEGASASDWDSSDQVSAQVTVQ